MDLNVVPAWNVTKGGGIKIAVVDDGIENHEDLPNITGGYTPSNGGNGQPENTGKHGMAVTGIISGQHNSIGIKGIAPDAHLQSVNIFARGTTISHYAQAFYWAVDQGVDVISNSWGFVYEDVEIESINPPKYIIRKGAMCDSNPFPALTSAINFAATHGRNGKGCLITFASGNWAQEGPLGQNADECVTYPASLENVLAIGAVTPNGHRSIYSDYGPKLDFVAPSNDLNSSGSRSYFGVRTIDRMGSNGYSRYDYHSGFGGTSAATPAAAGAIALLLSAHPNLTRTEAVAVLQKTAKDLNTSGFDIQTGYGLINTAKAIAEAGYTAPVDPRANKNGDSDGDGFCNADDCHPNDSFYPASSGSACDDNDDSTENDKVTADGCGCQGETIACYNEGSDFDGDGYCLLDDCDDENADIPAQQGTPCNDNDDTTENDVIQADGCTCAGTLINNENNTNDNTDDNTTDNQGDQEDEGGSNGNGQDCSTPDNLALQGTASQSLTFFTFAASRANDGDKSKTHYSQTNYSRDPYWELDLDLLAELSQINVHFKSVPRSTLYLFVSENDFSGKSFEELMTMANLTIYELNSADSEISLTANAQYIRVQTPGFQSVALIELETFGCEITSGFTGAEASDVNLNEQVVENELTINAYPNPTSGDAFVQFRNSLGKSGELSIYNSLGVKVFQQSMKQIPIIPMHIDFGSAENGIYILALKSGNQRLTQKLIVNK